MQATVFSLCCPLAGHETTAARRADPEHVAVHHCLQKVQRVAHIKRMVTGKSGLPKRLTNADWGLDDPHINCTHARKLGMAFFKCRLLYGILS